MQSGIIAPYQGTLVDLLLEPQAVKNIKAQSQEWPSWQLTPRQLGDVELLLNGGFSPLCGFMNRADYTRVCESMQLSDGTFWPLPVTLDVDEKLARTLRRGQMLLLKDLFGVAICVLEVEDIWQPGLTREAESVYSTDDHDHPGVAYLRNHVHAWYIGGKIRGLELPQYYDFTKQRLQPYTLRQKMVQMGWSRVLAYETRQPIHRAEFEMIQHLSQTHNTRVVLQPTVGISRTGDVEHYARVRCYEACLPYFPDREVMLALLPYSIRSAGVREAALLAIVHRNHGCSHVIVSDSVDAYSDSSHQEIAELLCKHQDDLGVEFVMRQEMVYVTQKKIYLPVEQTGDEQVDKPMTPAQIEQRLERGEQIPPHQTFAEVLIQLRMARPPRSKQGFHYLLHRTTICRKIYRSAGIDDQIARNWRSSGDPTRW